MILTKDWNTEFLIVSGNIVRCLLYHILWQEVEIIKVGCLMHAYCLNVIALHLVAHFFLFSLSFHSRWLSLCSPPPSHGKTLKDMAISTLVANTFSLFFFVFFNDVINLSWPRCWRLWEVNDFQAGRTELFVVSSMNLCLPALLFFILTCVCSGCR